MPQHMLHNARLAALAAAAILSAAAVPPAYPAGEPPNILFLFTDDQREDTLGVLGNPVIKTPTLDRLAAQGTIFTNHFVTTSICCVSRACVLSGQYESRHGIDDFFKTFSPEQLRRTYPALLRGAGYFTGFIGKWGIGDSIQATAEGARVHDYWGGASHQTNFWHAIDCAYVTDGGLGDPLASTCTCPPDSRGVAGPHNRVGRENITHPMHLTTEIIPKKFEDFLDAKPEGQPFLMSVFFKAPHSPFSDYDERFADDYEGQEMPVPETATLEDRARRPEFFNQRLGAATALAWLQKPETLQEHQREYYRLMNGVDFSVRAMELALEERGLLDNTVILYSSDNGHFKGEHGFAGKWMMHEPSLRVPGFIHDYRQPDDAPGLRVHALTLQIDMAATMLDLAGLPVPPDYQGQSLLPYMEDPEKPGPQYVYYEHHYHHGGQIEPTEGVRGHRWKYMRYYMQDPVLEALYDLQEDPLERRNLADAPEFADELRELRALWEEMRDDVQ